MLLNKNTSLKHHLGCKTVESDMLFNGSLLKIANAHLTLQRLSNFTEKVVDLNYTCFEKIYGDSSVSPVIVLHGLLSSKNSWTWMSEAIHRATRRKLINVDARNHGDSPHCAQHTYIHMAHDTVKLIKKLELPKVTLLGQSMGGRTAMTLALLYPELVSSMIIVDISPISMSQQLTNNFPNVLDAINFIDFTDIVTVEEAVGLAKEHLHASGITQKDVVDFILKNVGIKPDETIGWLPNVEVLREYFPTLLKFPFIPAKMFPGPTLFIKAAQSDFLPPDDLPGIRGYYPQAQMKCVPSVGHNIQDEDPVTLLKFTTEFLIKYDC